MLFPNKDQIREKKHQSSGNYVVEQLKPSIVYQNMVLYSYLLRFEIKVLKRRLLWKITFSN